MKKIEKKFKKHLSKYLNKFGLDKLLNLTEAMGVTGGSPIAPIASEPKNQKILIKTRKIDERYNK